MEHLIWIYYCLLAALIINIVRMSKLNTNDLVALD